MFTQCSHNQIHVVLCPSSRLIDASTVRATGEAIGYERRSTPWLSASEARSVNADRNACGNSRPRFCALLRMPRAAFELKEYLGDTCLCRTADKEQATAPLRDSEMLAVQNPPADSRPAFP